MITTPRIVSVLTLSVCMCALPSAQETAEPFQGEEIERFLATARVVEMEQIGVGITDPERATLELDGVTHFAAFKDVDDEPEPGGTRMANGEIIPSLQDSYRLEIAAYVVDRIIGLGMVPATIERRIRGRNGSLQWWVGKMNEAERIGQGIRPPDPEAWNKIVLKRRLFDALINNIDRTLPNLRITEDLEIRLIDHSRSFQYGDDLRNPERLTRFSRSLLEGLERLEYEELVERLGKPIYLMGSQIRALLVRRDRILELARQRVAEFGEEAVLYR